MQLKICEMLGGVGKKIYLCISLAASQHNNQANSLFCVRFAQTLHKIGGISAIEASFIAFDLHNLCITLSCTRQIESKALFALVGKVFA